MSIARAAAMPNVPSLTALVIPSEDRRAGIVSTIMISLLLSAQAQADAIARTGPVLWRAGDGIRRSDDDGLSWRTVWSDDESEEDSACSAIAADATRVAALCGGRLLVSDDGVRFRTSAAPAHARRVVFQGGRAVTLAHDDRIRRDGAWSCRFDDTGAWIARDGGDWVELPDAAAYDLMDVIPDGAGGAFAWTGVGLVRLRPDPEPAEPSSAPWAPRLELLARHRNVDGFVDNSVFGALSFPLERPPALRGLRTGTAHRTLRGEMRARAARLRMAASRIHRSAKSRLRELRAQELYAQAAAVMETAP
jgi:hypothetical protein